MEGNWMVFLSEAQFREWLLSHADTLDLTLVDNGMPGKTYFGLFQVNHQKKGKLVNPGTLKTFKRLEPWFIRKETNSFTHGGWTKKAQTEHYYFKLSDEIKEMLRQTTMLWSFYDEDCLFRGFEDPVFFKDGKMIGYVITHHYEGVLCPDGNENTYKI